MEYDEIISHLDALASISVLSNDRRSRLAAGAMYALLGAMTGPVDHLESLADVLIRFSQDAVNALFSPDN